MRCCGKGFQIPDQTGLQRLHCIISRQQSIVCCCEYSKIKQDSQIKCTRSDNRVGTLYANRHLNPINCTRSRPSSETLYTGASEPGQVQGMCILRNEISIVLNVIVGNS